MVSVVGYWLSMPFQLDVPSVHFCDCCDWYCRCTFQPPGAAWPRLEHNHDTSLLLEMSPAFKKKLQNLADLVRPGDVAKFGTVSGTILRYS